jgi:hypothetical protein
VTRRITDYPSVTEGLWTSGILYVWEPQQEVCGTSSTTGSFVLPNLVVLTVAGNEIKRFLDFVNILAAAAAIGREL